VEERGYKSEGKEEERGRKAEFPKLPDPMVGRIEADSSKSL